MIEDAPRLAAVVSPIRVPLDFMPAVELPDSIPSFGLGDTRVDRRGRTWARTPELVGGGAIYDVFTSDGALISRVAVARGRRILGFGPGDVVYLEAIDADGAHLERATLPR